MNKLQCYKFQHMIVFIIHVYKEMLLFDSSFSASRIGIVNSVMPITSFDEDAVAFHSLG